MSTTPNLGLTYLTSGQLQPEVTVNSDLLAIDSALGGKPAAFGNNPLTASLLTYGYYGGLTYSNGLTALTANGTLSLPASLTSYIQRTAQGVVSSNTVGFTAGLIPMAVVVTSATAITTITDKRPSGYTLQSRLVVNVGAPTAPTLTTATTGGTLAAGTYSYRISAVYPWGESAAGAEISVTTTGTTSSNVIGWTIPPQATSVNIYGRTTGGELKIATVLAGTSSYTDAGSVTPAGALPTGTMTLGDAQVNAEVLSLQGLLGGNTTLDFPLYSQEWTLSNETTGGFSLSAQTSNGSPVVLLSLAPTQVYGNGTLIKPTVLGVTNPFTSAGFKTLESMGKQGAAVLVAGVLTVSNTAVTANSRIFLTSQADGGTPGFLRVSSRVVGTSFTITSSSTTDTSTVAYEIFEPG